MRRLLHGPGSLRLGDVLKENLSSTEWTVFRAAIAFIKYSGIKHIYKELKQFANGNSVSISVGVDAGGTSYDGLSALLSALDKKGEVWVFHNLAPSTFHPKLYLFYNPNKATCIIGSGNLTEGGLFSNYEVCLQIDLFLDNSDDKKLFEELQDILDKWSAYREGLCLKLDESLLARIKDEGFLTQETMVVHRENQPGDSTSGEAEMGNRSLFKWTPINEVPKIIKVKSINNNESLSNIFDVQRPAKVFAMTLQNTDVGKGQITPGTARRSPEIYIPLVARNFAPNFWGWPDKFIEDTSKPGKMDRRGVKMELNGAIIQVNMMTWPDKSDFRLRSEAIRSAGNVNDILVLERLDRNDLIEYKVRIITPTSQDYSIYVAVCDHKVKGNSRKKWGYRN